MTAPARAKTGEDDVSVHSAVPAEPSPDRRGKSLDPRHARLVKLILLLSSLATIAMFLYEGVEEYARGEWRDAQRAYGELLLESASDDLARRSAERFAVEHRQHFLPGFGVVDRCPTCHLGVENPAMAAAEQPFRTHSGEFLARHPPERFGCTACHDGQGRATTRDEAHGWRAGGEPVPHAEQPLLRGDRVFTSCGRCHYEIDLFAGQSDLYAGGFGRDVAQRAADDIRAGDIGVELRGADVLRRGKEIVVERGCLGCHRYRGRGGDLGPDLTYVGDKHRHDFDLTNVAGEPTIENWLFEHFRRPRAITPRTVMPSMDFSPEEARSLTLYMMSLRRKDAPASHTPRPRGRAPAADEPLDGATLYTMFCSACHGPTGAGDGPAAKLLEVEPRNFRDGSFRYVSTPGGAPTTEDLVKTIGTGRRLGDMPRNPQLTDAEVLRLAEHVRKLRLDGLRAQLASEFGEDEISAEEIAEIAEERLLPEDPISAPPPSDGYRADPERGRLLYAENCTSCHGAEGRGDGPQELVDEFGRRILPRDITTGDFHGGTEPEEIFKRIRVGLPGTPMPAQDSLPDDDVWQLVDHVLTLAGRSR